MEKMGRKPSDPYASFGSESNGPRTSSSSRLRTAESPIRTFEAHAGHSLALLPTALQSWHRYADSSGKCMSL
jgi:hypothetical protein